MCSTGRFWKTETYCRDVQNVPHVNCKRPQQRDLSTIQITQGLSALLSILLNAADSNLQACGPHNSY